LIGTIAVIKTDNHSRMSPAEITRPQHIGHFQDSLLYPGEGRVEINRGKVLPRPL